MRVRSFGSLVYREFFLARKNIGSNLSAYLAISVLGLLIYLSLQYGNLALIPKEEMELEQEFINMFLYTFPLLMGSGTSFALAESSKREVYKPWMRFCHTTPVGCTKFALAKYTTLMLLNLVAFMLACAYMWIIAKVSGDRLGMGQISVVIVVLTVSNIFGVFLQVFTMLFGSQDKAGILMLGVMIVTEVVIVTNQKSENEAFLDQVMTWNDIQSWCLSHLAIVFMIFVLTNVVGFVATALLYKRREK